MTERWGGGLGREVKAPGEGFGREDNGPPQGISAGYIGLVVVPPLPVPHPFGRAGRRCLAGAACVGALALAAAGCGGGGSGGGATSAPVPASPAVVRYRSAGNGICRRAAERAAPLTARVRAAGTGASLADVRAVVAATARVRTDLAGLTPPPALRAAHRRMLALYGQVVVRLRHDLATDGRTLFKSVQADGVLNTLGGKLGGSWTELGLTACRQSSG